MFHPNLAILAAPQRRLWDELKATPNDFVLYGGTALALRLGHRQSEDFDFFSNQPFVPAALRDRLPYLRHAEMSQFQDNTLTAILERGGPVKISFLGGLSLRRVCDPDVIPDNGIQVASLLDLAATKLVTIQQRALAKDYFDLAAIMSAGMDLAQSLAAARAVYGKEFNGGLSLKALTYFADGDLPSLSPVAQKTLREAALGVNLKELPITAARAGLTP